MGPLTWGKSSGFQTRRGSCTCTLRINTTGSSGRPPKDQKGLDERALTAPQRPSPPCGHPRRRPCGRTAPAQATSSCHFPRPYLLTPLLAAATAARESAGLRAGSRRGQSAPPPWPAYRAASVWLSPSRWSAAAAAGPGVSCYEASKNCNTRGTQPTAAASPPLPCTACSPAARSCTSILRVILSPANQVQYPHFTTCVRGLCRGITPLFLPADVPGTPLVLRHAALCLAKRVYRRGAEAIPASAATAPALPRPEAVSWSHPQ